MYCEGREAGPNEGLLRVAHGVARSGMDEADSLSVNARTEAPVLPVLRRC